MFASFNHFLANEWDKAKAEKRGGGVTFISINATTDDGGELWEAIADLSAERSFARGWAIELLDPAFGRLREECKQANKSELFDQLKMFLTAEPAEGEYASLATRLGWAQGAVAVAVHRLRQRYRQLVLDEVAQTVSTPKEIQDELRQVMEALH